MSKCKPTKTFTMDELERFGVIMTDSTNIKRVFGIKRILDIGKIFGKSDKKQRTITISIPYEVLRDNKEVQVAFQDLVYISTTEK